MEAAQFSGRDGRKAKDGAAAEGLHTHAEERGAGEGMMARINRTESPGERGTYQSETGERVDAIGVADAFRANQQRHPGKTEQKSGDHAGARAVSTGAQPVNEDHPEGDGSHQQGSDAGGYELFRPGDGAVAHGKQENAGDDSGAPLREGGLLVRGMSEIGIKDKPHGQVT